MRASSYAFDSDSYVGSLFQEENSEAEELETQLAPKLFPTYADDFGQIITSA